MDEWSDDNLSDRIFGGYFSERKSGYKLFNKTEYLKAWLELSIVKDDKLIRTEILNQSKLSKKELNTALCITSS